MLPKVVALAIAVLLNQQLRGIWLYRSIFYLPTVTSGVATARQQLRKPGVEVRPRPGSSIIASTSRSSELDPKPAKPRPT